MFVREVDLLINIIQNKYLHNFAHFLEDKQEICTNLFKSSCLVSVVYAKTSVSP